MITRDGMPYRQSTLGIVTDSEGKFLVVNKMAYQEGQWAFPSGGVDGDGIKAVKWITREEPKTHLVFPNQWENAEKVIKEFILK